MDRALWSGVVLKLGYVSSRTNDLFVIDPVTGDGIAGVGQPSGLLGLFSTDRENYSEAEATLRFHPIKEIDLNISYVWSRSRGDLNTLGNI